MSRSAAHMDASSAGPNCGQLVTMRWYSPSSPSSLASIAGTSGRIAGPPAGRWRVEDRQGKRRTNKVCELKETMMACCLRLGFRLSTSNPLVTAGWSLLWLLLLLCSVGQHAAGVYVAWTAKTDGIQLGRWWETGAPDFLRGEEAGAPSGPSASSCRHALHSASCRTAVSKFFQHLMRVRSWASC